MSSTVNPYYPNGSSTASSTTGPGYYGPASSSSGPSSSLYLFAFLITVVVLGLISATLLIRAAYVRRQFQRRVAEAIREGRPLPVEAVNALGLGRPSARKVKKVGPMPELWEAEMYRDYGNEKVRWEDMTPVSMTHEAPSEDSLLRQNLPSLPQSRGPAFLRPFQIRHISQEYLTRPTLGHTDTLGSLSNAKAAYTIPDHGEEVVMGVMIAMPVERGSGGSRWDLRQAGEEEERDVPEVCLGVVGCRVE